MAKKTLVESAPLAGEAVVRVAIYCRISTDETHQPWSLGAQLASCEAKCAAQQWTVVARYQDEQSGATLERPQLQRALDDAAAGKFDVLLFYRLDRFSRKLRHLLDLIMHLEDADVKVASVVEPIDTTSPIGRVLISILGAFAELERDTMRDRVRQGMVRRAQSGKWSGSLPAGMMMNDRHEPVADPKWLPVIERIFCAYVYDLRGSTTIARDLNAEGIRTPTGAKWSGPKIILLLRSAAFVGMIRWDGKLLDARHDAVIDKGLWDEAQQILRQRRDEPQKRRSNSTGYLLSGSTRCARCGSPYVGSAGIGRGGRYRYYACHGRIKFGKQHCDNQRIRADHLEMAVINQLLTLLADTELLERAWERAEKAASGGTVARRKEIGRIDNELAQTARAQKKYLDAFEAETLEPRLLQARLDELSLQERALQERRAQLDARVHTPRPFPADVVSFVRSTLLAPGVDLNARTKGLLALVIKQVNIIGAQSAHCTYRLPGKGEVRVQTGQVPPTGFEPVLPA